MLTLQTEKECQLIIKNVLAACKDIRKLNKRGYNFLYLASGFIAHYNLGGFIAEYTGRSLSADILSYARQNQWCNFRIGEKDAEYYHQKRDIYNAIVSELAYDFNREHFVFCHISNNGAR
jgi:hypothetical protein